MPCYFSSCVFILVPQFLQKTAVAFKTVPHLGQMMVSAGSPVFSSLTTAGSSAAAAGASAAARSFYGANLSL